MFYLVMQLGLGPADALLYQSMVNNTVSIVKTAVHNSLLTHSESEESRLRRNIRALSHAAHVH